MSRAVVSPARARATEWGEADPCAQNEKMIDTTYTNNAQSMLGYVYHAAFWTAKKVV